MSDFRKLDYAMMPVDGGQIVDVSYAMEGDYLYRKDHDKSDNTTSYSRATVDLETDSRIQVRFGRDLMSTQTSIASQMILECAEFERYTPDGMKIDNPNYEGDWDADISSEAAETVAHWILQLYTDSKISNLKEFEPWNNQLPDIDGEWEAYETRFRVWDDGNSEIIEAEDMDAAKETAEEIWQDGSWDNKIYIDVYIQQLDFDDEPIGDMDEIEVECGEEPPEPDCADGEEHEWESPHELVGGLTENPGVWSTGGTTYVTKTVCKNCGIYRTETEYGSQRKPQQCDKIEYEDSDDDSLKWVAKANRYIGWYDCVNDRYGNHSEPYETESDFLDMVLDCWGREDGFQLPAMSCENDDGEIYATTKDGERELTLVKRVKKDLD